MVYGALGRRGVYDIQDAMKQLGAGLGDGARLEMVKRLLDGLPQSHWLRRNPFIGDHFQGGDAGLYDLLLHSRDRAYTVPTLLDFIAAGGGRPVALISPAQYDPQHYLKDSDLAERAAALPEPERWALAERLSGALTKHIAYIVAGTRPDDPVARLDADWRSMVPVLRDMDPRAISAGIRGGGILKADLAPGQPYRAALPDFAPEIVARITGKASLGEIFEDFSAGPGSGLGAEAFLELFVPLSRAFGDINRLLFHGFLR